MAHSDDDGLILPPRIAPFQVVIVPIFKGADQKALIDGKVAELVKELKPRKAYFTHISHQLGLHEAVSKELPANIELAVDGLQLII